MRRVRVTLWSLGTLALVLAACGGGGNEAGQSAGAERATAPGEHPRVVLETSLGNITIELYPDQAPITVENFLEYVDAGFYDGTIFHRVIPGFMIQGGGFTAQMEQKRTRAPIRNEADNGLRNEKGTIAMARTSDPNSATAQFFINLADNAFLDHGARDFGYAVFGRVVDGMDVVERIAQTPTTTRGGHQNVPAEPVVIVRARRADAQ